VSRTGRPSPAPADGAPPGRAALSPLLFLVGALAFVGAGLAHRGSVAFALAVGGALALVSGGVMVGMTRSARARHAAVVARNPSADVVEVWGAVGLADALRAEGVDPTGIRRTQGTALSLVVGARGVALWRGPAADPRLVVALGWHDVAQVVEDRGVVANNGPRAAVALVTRRGNALVLCPARNPAGGLVTADPTTVRALVARMSATRAAA